MRLTKQLGQQLFEAYQELFQAVENGIGTDDFFQLRERFRTLQTEVHENEEQQEALHSIRQKAQETFTDEDIEVDDDAVVSESEEGAFIEAWLWIPDNEE